MTTGDSVASTLTTLTRPRVVATPYDTVPTSSSRPGSAAAGSARHGSRTGSRRVSSTPAVHSTSATRLVNTAHGAPPSEAAANAVRNPPNASADSAVIAIVRAVACAAPAAGPRAGRDAASTTPATASGMPTSCSSAGRSPSPIATTTGTTEPVAPIGMTMLIGPAAAAVYSAARATPLNTPASTPQSRCRASGATPPVTASRPAAPTTPTLWPASSTPPSGYARVSSGPR